MSRGGLRGDVVDVEMLLGVSLTLTLRGAPRVGGVRPRRGGRRGHPRGPRGDLHVECFAVLARYPADGVAAAGREVEGSVLVIFPVKLLPLVGGEELVLDLLDRGRQVDPRGPHVPFRPLQDVRPFRFPIPKLLVVARDSHLQAVVELAVDAHQQRRAAHRRVSAGYPLRVSPGIRAPGGDVRDVRRRLVRSRDGPPRRPRPQPDASRPERGKLTVHFLPASGARGSAPARELRHARGGLPRRHQRPHRRHRRRSCATNATKKSWKARTCPSLFTHQVPLLVLCWFANPVLYPCAAVEGRADSGDLQFLPDRE